MVERDGVEHEAAATGLQPVPAHYGSTVPLIRAAKCQQIFNGVVITPAEELHRMRCSIAGRLGLEHGPAVLETAMLRLHPTDPRVGARR